MRSRAASIANRAASALVVRRAVAPALLRGVIAPNLWRHAAAVTADAWQLFLRVERCACGVQRLLSERPTLLEHGTPIRAVIAGFARQETARIMVARAHLRAAAATAAEHGLRVLVLKGGVLAVGDDAIDLTDVDLLLREEEARIFAEDLRARGWRSIQESTAHVDQSLESHGMRIEVHHGLGLRPELEAALWEQSVPLDGLGPLQRLGPVANLHHVVEHVAIHHSNRRTRLRDLVLIAHAARACTAAQIAEAFARPGADYAGQVCRTTLEAALESPAKAERDLERHVLMGYILELRPPVPYLPREISEFVEMWSVCMLQTSWEQRQVWAGTLHASLGLSSRPIIRAVERRHAAIGRAWRITARAAYRAATWALARPAASQVRRTVDRALRSPILLDS